MARCTRTYRAGIVEKTDAFRPLRGHRIAGVNRQRSAVEARRIRPLTCVMPAPGAKRKRHEDRVFVPFDTGLERLNQPAAARARRGVSAGVVSLRARFFGFLDLVCSSLPVNSITESIAASPRRWPNLITRV